MKKHLIGLMMAMLILNGLAAQETLECEYIKKFLGGTSYSSDTDTLISKLYSNSNFIKDTTTIPDGFLKVIFSSHIVENQLSILNNYPGFIRLYEVRSYTVNPPGSLKPDTLFHRRILSYAAVYDIPQDLTKKELKHIISEIKKALKVSCNLKRWKKNYFYSDYRNKKEGKWVYSTTVDGLEVELAMHQSKESEPFALWLIINEPLKSSVLQKNP